MKAIVFYILTIIVFSCSSVLSETVDSAGVIKVVSGDASILHAGIISRAAVNMKIQSGDSIQTSASGYVGIIFEDDTVMSIGPMSTFALDDFQFSPAERELSFVVRMIKGTFSFLSGQIAKLAPQKVKLETPDATLGIRGTKLLVKVE